MNEIEKSVLSMGKVSNKPNPLKRKRLDGTIEDNSDDRKPKKTFEEILLSYLEADVEPVKGKIKQEN